MQRKSAKREQIWIYKKKCRMYLIRPWRTEPNAVVTLFINWELEANAFAGWTD